MAAHRRNIRRLRIQRLLLLLLRCLAILLLAAGVAQFTPQGRALQTMLGSNQTLDVVVWDDAYTMAYEPPGSNSVFSDSRDLLTGWLMHANGPQRVAILRGSSFRAPLMDQPTADLALAMNMVQVQKLTDASADLAGGLAQALKIVQDQKSRTSQERVWLITDAARGAFGVDQSQPFDIAPRLSSGQAQGGPGGTAERLRQIADGITATGAQFRVIDLGSPDAVNMAVTNLSTIRSVVVVNQPLRIKCTIFNASTTAASNVPVNFYLDGVPAGRQLIDQIDAGSSAEFTMALAHPVTGPGMHVIEARLEPDGLPVDDVRRLVVQAFQSVPMLVVDGEQGDPERGILPSTAWLTTALAPEAGAGVFTPQTISELQLPDETLEHYRAVILSDTGAPDAELAARLRQFVSSGGLLMIFPGPDTNPSQWTAALGTGPHGLLPAALGLATTPAGASGTVGFNLKHTINSVTLPFIRAEQSGIHTGFTSVNTSRYVALEIPPESPAQIIAEFSNGAPAVVMRNFGAGRVVQWATTCDTRWTEFPAQPSYLPFLYELFYAALPDSAAKWNLQVGQAIAISAGEESEQGELGEQTELTDQSWRGPEGISVTMNRRIVGDAVEVLSDPIWQTGIYQNDGGEVAAVNVDPVDADIRHLSADQIAAVLGISPGDVLEHPQSPADLTVSQANAGGDAGQKMIMLALAVLVMETLLARAFSRYSHADETKEKSRAKLVQA